MKHAKRALCGGRPPRRPPNRLPSKATSSTGRDFADAGRGRIDSVTRAEASTMRRHPCGVVLGVLVVLVLALAGHAQALSTANLADDWRVTFVSSPTFAFSSTAVR